MTDTADANVTTAQLVRRYLSTVVVIDDQPVYEPPSIDPDEDIPGSEASENPAGTSEAPNAELIVPGGVQTTDDASHDLLADPVSRAFAEVGMVCAIVRPPDAGGADELAASAIRRADVVILDWKLAKGENPGTTATRILTKLLDASARQPVRLVCIYTAEPGVADIASELAERLDGATKDAYNLVVGTTSITVFGKPDNGQCSAQQRVTPEALPERVVTAFSHAVEGLVPTFAIAALGAIREDSGHLLRRFRADIDPGLLGHRILLPVPDDCADHLRDVLSDELNSIMAADALVRSSVGAARCVERAATLLVAEETIRNLAARFKGKADLSADVEQIVREGVDKGEKWTTRLFAAPDLAQRADLDFAELMQVRGHHSATPPLLALGVIVGILADSNAELDPGYYLCVQPLCDSVRIKGAQAFPFIPLRPSEDEPAKFVISNSAGPLALAATVKLYGLRAAEFASASLGPGPVTATASTDGSGWHFHDTSSPPGIYRFVGRLRDALSQRIAHDLGTDAGRVGTNDPEWLRRERRIPRNPTVS